MTAGPYDPTRDWCSCSPDQPFGVSIGEDCWQHDVDCEEAAKEPRFWRRQQLYRRAHYRLRAAIMRRFRNAGKPVLGRMVATLYLRGLQRFNLPFRVLKRWWKGGNA